jgi:hypothetical protein
MEAAVPPIRIAKPGTFTSVEGVKVKWTLANVQAAADAYDAEADHAPLVIGHPTLTAPAYGWAKQLRGEDSHLVADPDPARTAPAFAEAVRAGHYRKVSPRFYLPGSPGNPRPGSLYLQHIGYLGAAAPAIKGLGTVNFAAAPEEQLVTFERKNQEQEMSKETEASFAERTAELEQREASFASACCGDSG